MVVRGEHGKCSHLYHYFIHPTFGWLYVRLQTWFPFEMQVGINGREWLARQMDRANIPYQRSDNKFLWVQDWGRVQQLFDQQLQTDWVRELDALQQQVHPLHPGHLSRMAIKSAIRTHWPFILILLLTAATRFVILFHSQTHVHSDEAIIGLMGVAGYGVLSAAGRRQDRRVNEDGRFRHWEAARRASTKNFAAQLG